MHTPTPFHLQSVARSARICVALALFAGGAAPALAQSSVSLYGTVDLSVGRVQNSGTADVTSLASGQRTTSYFGFQGQEDLGGGLSAVFGLESWFAADTGTTIGSGFFARRSNVGLKSNTYGTLLLGNNPTSLFLHALLFNPYANSQGLSPTQRALFSRYAATEGGTVWQNSVHYQSPVIGGFSGTASAAFKEAAGGNSSYAASGLYADGPLSAGVAWQNWRVGTADQSTVLVGASYDFQVVKLYGQAFRVKDSAHNDDTRFAQIGAKAPLGKGALLASYGHTKTITTLGNYKTKTLTFGYDYPLSKRTDMYATAMYDKLSYTTRGMTYLVGLRHNF